MPAPQKLVGFLPLWRMLGLMRLGRAGDYLCVRFLVWRKFVHLGDVIFAKARVMGLSQ